MTGPHGAFNSKTGSKKNCFNTDSVVGSGLGLLPGLFEFFGGGRDPEHVELLGEVMIPTPKGADVSSLQRPYKFEWVLVSRVHFSILRAGP